MLKEGKKAPKIGNAIMDQEETIRLIEATIDKIRPFLRRDGGDIELIGFRDGIVYVSMVGACQGCIMAGEDISTGVEVILMEEVPGVLGVRMDNIPPDLYDEYLKKKQEAALKAVLEAKEATEN